jgi:hypothetical protein
MSFPFFYSLPALSIRYSLSALAPHLVRNHDEAAQFCPLLLLGQ